MTHLLPTIIGRHSSALNGHEVEGSDLDLLVYACVGLPVRKNSVYRWCLIAVLKAPRSPMPTIAIFFGIVVRMWHDDHPPPHIHVEYQGFEALVAIATGDFTQGQLPFSHGWS